ncbi:putative membrane protein [Porphyridium purpureum]|uniref:Putative membrane protein n=1 Tax=Porphyridium purpureum TaxID=35688 RepID=A0A5J4YKC4_PORPP|nr:putative membrane protein [Porphyridium purpureum]|eukprot:POR4076..scf244_11
MEGQKDAGGRMSVQESAHQTAQRAAEQQCSTEELINFLFQEDGTPVGSQENEKVGRQILCPPAQTQAQAEVSIDAEVARRADSSSDGRVMLEEKRLDGTGPRLDQRGKASAGLTVHRFRSDAPAGGSTQLDRGPASQSQEAKYVTPVRQNADRSRSCQTQPAGLVGIDVAGPASSATHAEYQVYAKVDEGEQEEDWWDEAENSELVPADNEFEGLSAVFDAFENSKQVQSYPDLGRFGSNQNVNAFLAGTENAQIDETAWWEVAERTPSQARSTPSLNGSGVNIGRAQADSTRARQERSVDQQLISALQSLNEEQKFGLAVLCLALIRRMDARIVDDIRGVRESFRHLIDNIFQGILVALNLSDGQKSVLAAQMEEFLVSGPGGEFVSTARVEIITSSTDASSVLAARKAASAERLALDLRIIQECYDLLGEEGSRFIAAQAVLVGTIQGGSYDARARAFVLYLCETLKIPLTQIAAVELALAIHLVETARTLAMDDLPPLSPAEAVEMDGVNLTEEEKRLVLKKRKKKQRYIRAAKISGIALVGGVLFGVTGGLIAPALLASLAGIGVIGAAGLAATGTVASGAVVGSLFGVGGIALAGNKARRRTKSKVSDFDFERRNDPRVSVQRRQEERRQRRRQRKKGKNGDGKFDEETLKKYEGQDNAFGKRSKRARRRIEKNELAAAVENMPPLPSLHICLCVPGWLTSRAYGKCIGQFELLLQHNLPCAEGIALRWETHRLKEMARAFAKFWASKGTVSTIQQTYPHVLAAASGAAGAVAAAIAFPLTLISAMDYIDNPWSILVTRANGAGEELAAILAERTYGQRPVTLIGYSLGARVVFKCLASLAARSLHGIIDSAFLLGAPVSADVDQWRNIRSIVANRLVNCFCASDWALAFFHRGLAHGASVAGLTRVKVPQVENLNMTYLGCFGHRDLCEALPVVSKAAGLGSGYICMPPAPLKKRRSAETSDPASDAEKVAAQGGIGMDDDDEDGDEFGEMETLEEVEKDGLSNQKALSSTGEKKTGGSAGISTDGHGEKAKKSKFSWMTKKRSSKTGSSSGGGKGTSTSNSSVSRAVPRGLDAWDDTASKGLNAGANEEHKVHVQNLMSGGDQDCTDEGDFELHVDEDEALREFARAASASSPAVKNTKSLDVEASTSAANLPTLELGLISMDGTPLEGLNGKEKEEENDVPRTVAPIGIEITGRRILRLVEGAAPLPVAPRHLFFTNCETDQLAMSIRILEGDFKSVPIDADLSQKTLDKPRLLFNDTVPWRDKVKRGTVRVLLTVSVDVEGNVMVDVYQKPLAQGKKKKKKKKQQHRHNTEESESSDGSESEEYIAECEEPIPPVLEVRIPKQRLLGRDELDALLEEKEKEKRAKDAHSNGGPHGSELSILTESLQHPGVARPVGEDTFARVSSADLEQQMLKRRSSAGQAQHGGVDADWWESVAAEMSDDLPTDADDRSSLTEDFAGDDFFVDDLDVLSSGASSPARPNDKKGQLVK